MIQVAVPCEIEVVEFGSGNFLSRFGVFLRGRVCRIYQGALSGKAAYHCFPFVVLRRSFHSNRGTTTTRFSQLSQLCRRIPPKNTHQHSRTHIHACFSDVFDSPASSTTFSSNQRRLFHDEISPPCHCAAAVAEPFPPVPNTGFIVFCCGLLFVLPGRS